MNIADEFARLPGVEGDSEYNAIRISARRSDFLAKSRDGSPVLLLHDASPPSYVPGIKLRNVEVQFHCTCRVRAGVLSDEGQYAVITSVALPDELHELFIRCFAAAADGLALDAGTSDIEIAVRNLLEVFRALSTPSTRSISGLWAELFVIANCAYPAHALQAWHADPQERFDFAKAGQVLEVKASLGTRRLHDFRLEQLAPPAAGEGLVASLLLQPMTGGTGVVQLARFIEAHIQGRADLREKLWSVVLRTLGSDFSERLDRTYDGTYAYKNLEFFLMRDIPCPQQPLDKRVTDVRFRADLSGVVSGAGAAKATLARLFS